MMWRMSEQRDWMPGEKLPGLPIDWERMAQLLVALVMVAAACYLLLRGMDRGGSAVWGTTIVGALLVIGAIGLAIDRRQP